MTGLERFDPNIQGQIKYEHYHRYALAAEHVTDAVVLDLACGVGYGAHILSEKARKVVGIDISEEAITEATLRYGRHEAVEFLTGSANAVSYPDATFDVVVSFETIEHLHDVNGFLDEVKRVLKPNGLLILSSPEKEMYNKNRVSPNEFHVNELTLEEFSNLITDRFNKSVMLGQRMILGSSINPLDPGTSSNQNSYSAITVQEDLNNSPSAILKTVHSVEPIYLICFASDHELPNLTSSIFLMPSHDLWLEHSKVIVWASNLHEEQELRRREASALAASNQAKGIKSEADRLLEALAEAAAELRISRLQRKQAELDTLNLEILSVKEMADGWRGLVELRQYVRNQLNGTRGLMRRPGKSNVLLSFRRFGRSHITPATLRKELKIPVRQADFGRLAHALDVLFDPLFYRSRLGTPIYRQTGFAHFLQIGQPAGISPHPLIDLPWISRHTGTDEKPFDLINYILDPDLYQLQPHMLFDAAGYLARNADVVSAGINPLVHYLENGWMEGREPNLLFDDGWYIKSNPDVATSGSQPLVHYAQYGWRENRAIHPLFDGNYYLAHNLDVAEAQADPLAHFLLHGMKEGRSPSAAVQNLVTKLPPLNIEQVMTALVDTSLEWENASEPPISLGLANSQIWPPKPASDYHLPQQLRHYIADRYGEKWGGLYRYLFSVIERYAAAPESFDRSLDIEPLIRRCSTLANRRARSKPTVSIVIPVYNNLLYTLTSIVSILDMPSAHVYEIIVGDDLSSDRTAEVIGRIGGVVRHHRTAANLGFLHNCNATAALARGLYIVFLNNDTVTLPDWLDKLIEPMERDQQTGLTGSKLLNGDGTLQEAGGILWQDGSAWNFGRNQDALLPEFNYLKDVDYISGASIAVRKSLWDQLGGFDPLFAPAYCEDTDLAFRIRQAGYRTLYSPHSVLVHHEGRTHGRDTGTGIKAYQVINQNKFKERWKDVLERDHFPNGESVFVARDRSRNRPHILIIDHYVPQWDQDAGSRTIYSFIKFFVRMGFFVTFWSDNLNEDREYTPHLQNLGVAVIYSNAYKEKFTEWISTNGAHIQYVILSRPHISVKYIDFVKKYSKTIILYYGHDLHHKRLYLEHEMKSDPLTLEDAKYHERIELEVCSKVNMVLYPSLEEIEALRDRIPAGIALEAVPMLVFEEQLLIKNEAGFELRSPDPYKLLFVGGFSHSPNEDGIIWFVKHVMPLLRQFSDRFHLSIAGSNVPDGVKDLASIDIDVLGRISDEHLDELYRAAGIAIVPLRFGGGVKGKVIEAMAKGVPVVMTSIGAQGILDPHLIALVADEPQEMADAIISAVSEWDKTTARTRGALAFIRRDYSEDVIRRILAGSIVELDSTAANFAL